MLARCKGKGAWLLKGVPRGAAWQGRIPMANRQTLLLLTLACLGWGARGGARGQGRTRCSCG